jgi:predicted phage tail protein
MNNLDDFKYIKGFGGGGGSQQAAQPTSAYEDAEGFVYQGASYNVYQFAKVKDLLSEGPIDGLVNGQYVFNGNIGDLGYNQVIYNEYPITIGDASAVSYLKSIQWNQTPLLDSQDKYNFQQINVSATNGTPIGTSVNGSFDNTSYIRSIGERLRGPNNLAVTQDEVADYQRSYRVSNKECKIFYN